MIHLHVLDSPGAGIQLIDMNASVTNGHVSIAGVSVGDWPPRRHVYDNDRFILYGERKPELVEERGREWRQPWALIVGGDTAEFCAVTATNMFRHAWVPGELPRIREHHVRATREEAEAMLVDIARGLQPLGSVALTATVAAGCSIDGPHQDVKFTQGAAEIATIRHEYGVAGRWAMLLAAAEQEGEAEIVQGGNTLSISADGTYEFTRSGSMVGWSGKGTGTKRLAAGPISALAPALRQVVAAVEGDPVPGPFLGDGGGYLQYRGKKIHYHMEPNHAGALMRLARGQQAKATFMSEGMPHTITYEDFRIVISDGQKFEWRIPHARAAPALTVRAIAMARRGAARSDSEDAITAAMSDDSGDSDDAFVQLSDDSGPVNWGAGHPITGDIFD